MFHYAIRAAEVIAVLGTCCALAYYVVCIATAARFQRETAKDVSRPDRLAPISILKALKGTDPGMYEAFCSHCLQDHPEYEIIFGVSDPADPVIELVNRLKKEFPERNIRLLICSEILGTNVKVSNLVQMARQATHDLLVVNDSDISVPTDYLRRLAAGLSDPQVGLVTCLYRARAAQTLGSRLEALGISTDFAAGVLVAQELERGLHFGLGSTLAFRKSDLQRIGGFESLLEYLADDYQLGAKLAQQGLRVKLSGMVVETFLPRYSFGDFVDHQLRWGRTIRDSRPWGYFGLVTTFGTAWALLTILFARGAWWAWALFAAMLVVRMAMAVIVGARTLGDSKVLPSLWLLPLRDLLAVVVWAGSFFGNTVRWRGDLFRLDKGKLSRISQ
jgi:ceramide glucosyltransferase